MTESNPNLNVHVLLQGKGGVGKSVIASLLAQWLTEANQRRAAADSEGDNAVAEHAEAQPTLVTCIDTDPVNATFSAYKALKVQRIDVLENDQINAQRFDDMIELVMKNERAAIIDNGASSFVPLAHYFLVNEVPALLAELGRSLILHVVIAGGPDLLDTLHGLDSLAGQFHKPTRFVVWLNPYFGPVQYEGKRFEQLKAYTENRPRISAIVTLPELQRETFGADLRAILGARKTFAEVLPDTTVQLMRRQRLRLIRSQIFTELDRASASGVL